VNWLKQGPELKMPDLKVPEPLVDLYWDLRDRHLLPLVVLAIVAIIAVPFLIGGGSKQAPAPHPARVGPAPSPEAPGAKLAVVEAKPGLRDYRKRLHRDKPTDPFKQRYTSPVLKGTKLGAGSTTPSKSSSTTSGGGSTTTVTQTKHTNGTTTTEVTTKSEGGPETGGAGSGGQLTLFTFAVDIRITKTTTDAKGDKKQEAPVVRHRVIPPAPLPSEKTPFVAYMGITATTRQPYFLISESVTGVFGDGKCIAGIARCELLELEPEIPETFVIGDGHTRYKINVLKVEPVTTGKTKFRGAAQNFSK
jgi:hypothetical protein